MLGLLDRLTSLNVPGSELLLDLVSRSLFEDQAMRPMLDKMAELGAPWLLGTEDPETLLSARGWDPRMSLFSEVSARMNRLPYSDESSSVPDGYRIRARRNDPVSTRH